MTRRLLAAALLTAFAGSGFVAATAHAQEDDSVICVYGENQRKPGQMKGICIDRLIDVDNG
jgi:hypothetical protein